MNQALVPVAEFRHEHELLDGIPNYYHDSQLAPADAGRINSSINIIGYAAEHGVPGAFPPNQRQYEEVAGLVNSLNPERGDKLFVEGPSHNGTPFTEEDLAGFRQNPQAIAETLEQMRRERSLDTFKYGIVLAVLKGVPVFSADIDKVQRETLEKTTGETMVKLSGPFSPHRDDLTRLRVKQAANTVKDHALEALPHISGDKPTYAVLYGMDHFSEKEASNIPDAFKDLGLEIETVELSKTGKARKAYQIGKLLVKATVKRKSPVRVAEDSLGY